MSTWTFGRLQAYVQDTRGQRLEAARVVAQAHVYDPSRPQEARRRWAKLSLTANRRMTTGDGAERVRVGQQDFTLRMWVIDELGPDESDPDWSPEALASDTLEALTLTPSQAAALADGRRALAVERIRELRWHKNLTAHLERLVGHLAPGATRDRLLTWTATRRLLP